MLLVRLRWGSAFRSPSEFRGPGRGTSAKRHVASARVRARPLFRQGAYDQDVHALAGAVDFRAADGPAKL